MLGYDRPDILTENNFELTFLSTLSAYKNWNYGLKKEDYFLIISLIILSGSLSYLASAAIIFYYSLKRNFISIVLATITLSLILITFIKLRGINTIESIDRVQYILNFINLVEWDIKNILFGHGILGQVPKEVCSIYNWSHLYSIGNPNICYNNIWQIGLLKLIWDFGLLGALFYNYLIYLLLRKVFKADLGKILFLIGFATSLSISGFSNTFFILGILFLYRRSVKYGLKNISPSLA